MDKLPECISTLDYTREDISRIVDRVNQLIDTNDKQDKIIKQLQKYFTEIK